MYSQRTRTRTGFLLLAALLATGCQGDSESPSAPQLDPARIVLSAATVELAGRQGDPSPAPQVLQIINGGEAQLTGLDVRVEYTGDPGSDWLVAILDRSTAPARVTVEANWDALDAGLHQARIVISSPVSANTAAVSVSLQLDERLLADLLFRGDPTLVDAVVKPQEALRFTAFEMANRGGAPASFQLRAYVSSDPEITMEDRFAGSWDYELEPGEAYPFGALGLHLPSDVPLGDHYIGFVLDPVNAVEESDEGNNVLALAFTLRGFTLDLGQIGAGTARVDPAQDGYLLMAEVTLTADAADGWTFEHWAVEYPGGEAAPATVLDNPWTVRVAIDAQVTAVFLPGPPALSGQVSETGRADLTWSFDWPCVRVGRSCQTSGEERYELEMRSVNVGGAWEPVDIGPDTRESPFTHSLRLEPGDWQFRVRAVGEGWTSPWTEPLDLVFYPPTPPGTPTNLEASASIAWDGKVAFNLSWDHANDVDEYFVQVAWDFPDFAGGTALDGRLSGWGFSTSETPGERLYFRLEARNAYGASEGAVTYAWVPIRPGTVRFINDTDYPVFSLVVNGEELLPGAEAYQRGQWYGMELAPGDYEFQMLNGVWDGSAWNALYIWAGTVTVEPGGSVDVTFPNPSATDLMTRFSSAHTWTGSYIDPGGVPRAVSVIFRDNGQYTLLVDGTSTQTGTYRLTNRAPAAFLVEFQLDGRGPGTLWETLGYFSLEMSPGYIVQLFP